MPFPENNFWFRETEFSRKHRVKISNSAAAGNFPIKPTQMLRQAERKNVNSKTEQLAMRLLLIMGIIAIIFLFGVLSISAQTVVVTAQSVTDGDTLTLKMSNGFQFTARLHGIDAPEIEQFRGVGAKTKLQELTNNQQLRAWIIAEDSFNRKLVQLLTLDYSNLNLAMVRSGWAWQDSSRSRDRKLYKEAQKLAQIEQIGLWQPTSLQSDEFIPCRPRKFRAGKCPGQ